MRMIPLSEVTLPISRTNPARSYSDTFTYVDLSAIGSVTKSIDFPSQISSNDAPSRARQIIRTGDVLVSTVRPNLNSVAIVPPRFDSCIASTGFSVLRADTGQLSPKYLYHWVRSLEFVSLMIRQSTGANYPAVTDKIVKGSKVPLPPLSEQRRIAAILDKADAIRQKRRQAIAHLDTLTQSIFNDMFASSQNMTSLQSICLKITDGTHQSPQWESAGVPFLFVSNITSGEIDFSTKKYISLATWRELTKNAPIQKGDVLFSTVGSFGATAVVRTDAPFAFQRHIAHIKPNRELVNPDFLSAQLSSTKLYRQATRAARGIAQPTVNLGDIRNFQVVCPEMELQSTFASIASRIREKKLKLRNSLANLNDLHSSLQSRAFRGEL